MHVEGHAGGSAAGDGGGGRGNTGLRTPKVPQFRELVKSSTLK